MAPPHCNLDRGFEHRNGGRRPFFLASTWFSAKNRTKFEWRPFFWSLPKIKPKTGLNLSEDLLFLVFTYIWAKNRTNFVWRPFFGGLHLILGRKTDLVLGWKFFIPVFIILKFSEFPGLPPFQNPAYATATVCDIIEHCLSYHRALFQKIDYQQFSKQVIM